MITFEQTLLPDVATLPESRHADVLAFVRFLKISLIDDEKLEQEFDEAIQDAYASAKKYNITQDVIDTEIRAVRDGKINVIEDLFNNPIDDDVDEKTG
jgi:hypothetical protein